MYGRSAAGTTTEPSACWYCSRIATIVRPTAMPEPLSVWTGRGFRLALGAVADLRAPRLEVLEVRARRDLAVRVLAGQPDLEVVGLRRDANPMSPVHSVTTR